MLLEEKTWDDIKRFCIAFLLGDSMQKLMQRPASLSMIQKKQGANLSKIIYENKKPLLFSGTAF